MTGGDEIAEAKRTLRDVAKETRSSERATRAERDRRINRGLLQWFAWRTPGWIIAFDSLPGETDLSALTTSALMQDRGFRFALTRTPQKGFDLTIHPATSELERHRFGYRQPVERAEVIPDTEISAVLVPALAFDDAGNRLGFGAGYYDRLLARIPQAHRVGIADLILAEPLPIESFDIPMTHLATIDGVRSVG